MVGTHDAGPVVARRRKDEDLDTPAQNGILKIHAGSTDPTAPDHTDLSSHTSPAPRLLERAS